LWENKSTLRIGEVSKMSRKKLDQLAIAVQPNPQVFRVWGQLAFHINALLLSYFEPIRCH
jgi:hypothetical protein